MENHESKSMGHVMRLHVTQHASPTQDQKEIRKYHTDIHLIIIIRSNPISIQYLTTYSDLKTRVNDFLHVSTIFSSFDFLCLLFFGIKLLDCLRMNL
jgi:hypothetical protein